MAGVDQRALEILIRARDLASAEMRRVADSAKKTGAEVKKSFGGDLLGSMKDSVNELKAFVRGFSLLQAGKFLFGLIQEWREVAAETAAARKELNLYLSLRGAPTSTKEELAAIRDTLLGLKTSAGAVSEQTANAIAILANRFKLVQGEAQALGKDAVFLADTFAAYKDDPVAAFNDLAKAQQGFADGLIQKTGLQFDQENALIELRKQRLIVEKELQAALLEPIVTQSTAFGDKVVGDNRKLIEDLKQQAAELRSTLKGIPSVDPLAGERAKRTAEEQKAADLIERQNRALADQKTLVRTITVDRSDFGAGLSEGFQQFRDEVTNFREQGEQTVLSLLGGVQQIGAGIIDGLITRTIKARDALKLFGLDMLRLLAQLAAQLAASQLLGALFNLAAGGATGGFAKGVQDAGYGGGIGKPLAAPGALGLKGVNGTGGSGSGGGTTNIIFQFVDGASADELLVRHKQTILDIVAAGAGTNRDLRVALGVR